MAIVGSMCVTAVFLCMKGFACFPPSLIMDLCNWKSVRSDGLRIGKDKYSRGQVGSEKTSLLLLCPLKPTIKWLVDAATATQKEYIYICNHKIVHC